MAWLTDIYLCRFCWSFSHLVVVSNNYVEWFSTFFYFLCFNLNLFLQICKLEQTAQTGLANRQATNVGLVVWWSGGLEQHKNWLRCEFDLIYMRHVAHMLLIRNASYRIRCGDGQVHAYLWCLSDGMTTDIWELMFGLVLNNLQPWCCPLFFLLVLRTKFSEILYCTLGDCKRQWLLKVILSPQLTVLLRCFHLKSYN